jgi:uncharacterized protein
LFSSFRLRSSTPKFLQGLNDLEFVFRSSGSDEAIRAVRATRNTDKLSEHLADNNFRRWLKKMRTRMYYCVVSEFARALRNIDEWLDKAQLHATEKEFNVQVLMESRLAPDMGAFVYQVQSACDYAKGAAAWLSGQTSPRHEDNEQTIDEVRARIQKTVAFIESVEERQYVDASQRTVRVSWSPPGKILKSQDYLLQVSIPNVYFHIMAAYAILPHNGVNVGKMDFLGPINWIDA